MLSGAAPKEDAANTQTSTRKSVASITPSGDNFRYARRTQPPKPRFCVADVNRRRRLARQHDELHREMHPREPRVPSDFGLEPDQLRHEANRLHSTGWQRSEITEVLDISVLTNGTVI